MTTPTTPAPDLDIARELSVLSDRIEAEQTRVASGLADVLEQVSGLHGLLGAILARLPKA